MILKKDLIDAIEGLSLDLDNLAIKVSTLETKINKIGKATKPSEKQAKRRPGRPKKESK